MFFKIGTQTEVSSPPEKARTIVPFPPADGVSVIDVDLHFWKCVIHIGC